MTEPFSAPQQPGTPAPPPPPPGPPAYYAPQAYAQQPPPGPPAYYAPQAYAQQPPRKSSKGLIIGIIVGVSAVVVVILGIVVAIAIPVFLNQRERANDAAARFDVVNLGKEVSVYFVDHDGGVPPIEVVDGYYVVDGVATDSAASAQVELGGIEGTGYDDWCVWVTAPDGADKTFEYSATGGLRVGTC